MQLKKITQKFWTLLSFNYWAIPGFFVCIAFGASMLLSYIDHNYLNQTNILTQYHFLNPETVRSVLSSIATSVMTVAGVAFSVTLLAEVHICSQIGPRVLAGFLDDQENQITLGILVSTFLFSLLTLLQISSETAGKNEINYFVPSLSVLFSLFLAIASVFSFISFIHHMSNTIRTSSAVSLVGDKTISIVEDFFSSTCLNKTSKKSLDEKNSFEKLKFTQKVTLEKEGYIQDINYEAIATILKNENIYIVFKMTMGDFLLKDDIFMQLFSDQTLKQRVVDKIKNQVTVSKEKTLDRNYQLGCSLLVEISARAMSPGVNDPVTYSECLDQLSRVFYVLNQHKASAYLLQDSTKTIRGLLNIETFVKSYQKYLTQLTYYAKDDPIASEHLSRFKKMIEQEYVT